MNWLRFTKGFLLSFVFLIFFAYIIFNIQQVFENYFSDQNEIFLGSISENVQNIVPQNINQNPIEDPVQNGVLNVIQNSIQPIDKPEVNAKSAISVESNLQDVNKILFEKDSNAHLPIASLTKLMTAVIVLDNYNLSDTAKVDKIADSQDPMKEDVKLGDIMPVESFLDIMLVGSSNKAAYALSELLGEQKFVGLMNQKSKDLGLQNTFFADPTGLDAEDVSTASDLTKLAEYILKNYPKIAEISRAKELDVPEFGKITNTDELLGKIPDIICSKTGFTAEANGCLLLIVNNPKNNNYLINVILGADDRFSEMEKLINWSSVICSQ
jgi:D-alanyl-D-alanine carboxypeptidase